MIKSISLLSCGIFNFHETHFCKWDKNAFFYSTHYFQKTRNVDASFFGSSGVFLMYLLASSHTTAFSLIFYQVNLIKFVKTVIKHNALLPLVSMALLSCNQRTYLFPGTEWCCSCEVRSSALCLDVWGMDQSSKQIIFLYYSFVNYKYCFCNDASLLYFSTFYFVLF